MAASRSQVPADANGSNQQLSTSNEFARPIDDTNERPDPSVSSPVHDPSDNSDVLPSLSPPSRQEQLQPFDIEVDLETTESDNSPHQGSVNVIQPGSPLNLDDTFDDDDLESLLPPFDFGPTNCLLDDFHELNATSLIARTLADMAALQTPSSTGRYRRSSGSNRVRLTPAPNRFSRQSGSRNFQRSSSASSRRHAAPPVVLVLRPTRGRNLNRSQHLVHSSTSQMISTPTSITEQLQAASAAQTIPSARLIQQTLLMARRSSRSPSAASLNSSCFSTNRSNRTGNLGRFNPANVGFNRSQRPTGRLLSSSANRFSRRPSASQLIPPSNVDAGRFGRLLTGSPRFQLVPPSNRQGRPPTPFSAQAVHDAFIRPQRPGSTRIFQSPTSLRRAPMPSGNESPNSRPLSSRTPTSLTQVLESLARLR